MMPPTEMVVLLLAGTFCIAFAMVWLSGSD
jgi:hypothetical protein